MRILIFAPALLFAGIAIAQESADRPNPLDSRSKVPPVEFKSAFEGYRPFADQGLRDWRKSNEDVGAAGGHAGHPPGQGPSAPSTKPKPGDPETQGKPATGHGGHGGHK